MMTAPSEAQRAITIDRVLFGERGGDAAMRAVMRLAGRGARMLSVADRTWRSATFDGVIVATKLCFEGAEAVDRGERFCEAVGDWEWTVPGWLVADASVVFVARHGEPHYQLTTEVALMMVRDV